MSNDIPDRIIDLYEISGFDGSMVLMCTGYTVGLSPDEMKELKQVWIEFIEKLEAKNEE